jgi:hypothetical protein
LRRCVVIFSVSVSTYKTENGYSSTARESARPRVPTLRYTDRRHHVSRLDKSSRASFRSCLIRERSAFAPLLKCPCFQAFLFPLGAPVDLPPCIRQRPFRMAGDRQRPSLRVFAPHRRLSSIASRLCMGLTFGFSLHPPPPCVQRVQRWPGHLDARARARLSPSVVLSLDAC